MNRLNMNFLINTGINLESLTEILIPFVSCQVALEGSKALWYFPRLVLSLQAQALIELHRRPF